MRYWFIMMTDEEYPQSGPYVLRFFPSREAAVEYMNKRYTPVSDKQWTWHDKTSYWLECHEVVEFE